MGWDADAPSGTVFTLTKSCLIKTGGNINILMVKDGKNFTIDGGPELVHAIYGSNKSPSNDVGTVIGFESGANASLTLRNIVIEGGGHATTPTGGDPDPAIVVKNGSLVLDGVLLRRTRGGGIRIDGSGTVTLINAKFRENHVAAGNYGSAITVGSSGTVITRGELVLRNNRGGKGPILVQDGGTFNIDELGDKRVTHNRNADRKEVGGVVFEIPPGPAWTALWNKIQPAARPHSGDDYQMALAKADPNYGRRIKGTVGSDRSAYYLSNSGGVLTLQIYRVDDNSVGHWVMNVSQAAIDTVSGPGCVAASPDGRYAVRVWADRNVTIADGPDMESKVFHNTLKGGVSGGVISTETTYSSTPPGVGCPGYAGDR